MLRRVLALFMLMIAPAWSQSTAENVVPGSLSIVGSSAKWFPFSSTNQLPISVTDAGNHAGFCFTSNGSGSPATFQSCGGGGGSGTVTSVTFTGDGTVLSSTPSSAVTTSGTLTATLAAQTQNTVLGAATSTTLSGLTMPSCSSASSALIWTTNTGFGCNTIAGGAVSITAASNFIVASPSPITGTGTVDAGNATKAAYVAAISSLGY